ncbi:hypothetical protein MTR67_040631 [Solanum verrucosum]|uniref:Uncharacterized protein n=1 Tax=Solanum verrucosum TaxID=315347 RepID=A0AAF0ULD4_SOLVR|nr:hypothetical protein MTR67_040631 [Solanum verrucosum]
MYRRCMISKLGGTTLQKLIAYYRTREDGVREEYIFVAVVIWRSHMMEIKADRNDGSLVLVKHGAEAVSYPRRPGAYSKQYAIDAAMHLTFEYVEGPS